MDLLMLEYIALGILLFAAITIFYGIILIHDIPYEIAKKRNHPQQDALHIAGWVSLFTLHVLWPFLWIWATLYREDRGWGFNKDANIQPLIPNQENNAQRIITPQEYDVLCERLNRVEKALAEQSNEQTTSRPVK
nr:DUF3302 domain-containing protein [Colwellia ponticola]